VAVVSVCVIVSIFIVPVSSSYWRYMIDCSVTLSASGTFCGVFRRQALDRGAVLIGCNKIVTGNTFLLTYEVKIKFNI